VTHITSAAQVRIFAGGIPSDFKVFKELMDFHSMQGQTKGWNFIQALLLVFRSTIG
jgi:hypothetical protein